MIVPWPESARRAASRAPRRRARAPARAASPRAHNAPTAPASTSPAPAVASCGTAVSTTRSGSPRRRNQRVRALQQHRGAGELRRLADARERALATAELSRPSNRPSSPACGVSAVGPARSASVSSRPEGAKSASASSTSGASTPRTRASTSARASGVRPRPGPATTARARASELEHPLRCKLAVHHQLGECAATAARSLSGTHTHTTPAPPRGRPRARRAPRPPLMPGEPPTTSTPPASYFDPSASAVDEREIGALHAHGALRAGECDRQADRQLDHSPAQPRPGSIAVPSVRPWNASVSAARIAAPVTRRWRRRPRSARRPRRSASERVGA